MMILFFSKAEEFSAPLLGIQKNQEQECVAFYGTLNRNNHKILGLTI